MLLCLPQADNCWNVVVKQFSASQIRGKFIAFSHVKINVVIVLFRNYSTSLHEGGRCSWAMKFSLAWQNYHVENSISMVGTTDNSPQ